VSLNDNWQNSIRKREEKQMKRKRSRLLIVGMGILLSLLIVVSAIAATFPSQLKKLMPEDEWTALTDKNLKYFIYSEPAPPESSSISRDELKADVVWSYLTPSDNWCVANYICTDDTEKTRDYIRKKALFVVMKNPTLRNLAYSYYLPRYQQAFAEFSPFAQNLLIEVLDDHLNYLRYMDYQRELQYLNRLRSQKCIERDNQDCSEKPNNEWQFVDYQPDGKYHPERWGFALIFRQIHHGRITKAELQKFLNQVKRDAIAAKKMKKGSK
jgi:hypothetical protein